MGINSPQKSNSNLLGFVQGIMSGATTGAMVGGPPGAVVGGILGASASAHPDSPGAKAIGLAESAGGVAGSGEAPNATTELRGIDDSTAIQRAIEKKSADPNVQIEKALALLHPDNGLDLSTEDRVAFAEPLLRAKHFGYGGNLG